MAGGDSTFRPQSVSAATSLSSRTVMSTNDLASFSREDDDASTQSRHALPRKPFVTKNNGRTYLSDPTLPYPLPVDLQELHRQSLRTLLLFQLFGGPVCSPAFAKRPPTRVLDLGCGYGFWSMMCHSYFSRKGHSNISFTGLDIAALGGISGVPNPGHHLAASSAAAAPKERGSLSSASGNWAEQPPDKNMQWTFIQHDMRSIPFPFADGEFDLVMCKELSLVTRSTHFQELMDECLRLLKPGGVLEVWDCDHPIRMLRPHVPDTPTTTTAPKLFDHDLSAATTTASHANGNDTSNGNSNSSKKGEQESLVTELGAYHLGNSTPLSGPQNTYLYEYNTWINKYLESQQLLNWPCANIGSYFIQEPLLTALGSKRLAIPLTEVRWEREVVGGVVTKDGKSYIDTGKLSGRSGTKAGTSTPDRAGNDHHSGGNTGVDGNATGEKKSRVLGSAQLALRQTALQTVLGFIEAMEPVLRETSGKKQDEWDAWMGKLMKELIEKDGASCGECLEVGAWWGTKTLDSSS